MRVDVRYMMGVLGYDMDKCVWKFHLWWFITLKLLFSPGIFNLKVKIPLDTHMDVLLSIDKSTFFFITLVEEAVKEWAL